MSIRRLLAYYDQKGQAFELSQMNADEKYAIPQPKKPEPTEKRPHPQTFGVSIAALVVALIAAGFAGWQACEAHEARTDAKQALNAQAKDVERSRKAAENSASAAKALAESSLRGLAIAERSAHAAESSADTAQNLYELNFVPAVEITYDNGRLNVANKGKQNIWLWGTKFDNGRIDIEREGRLITPGGFYYILGVERLLTAMRNQSKEIRLPLRIFIQTENRRRYVAEVQLWVVFKENGMEVHTQTLEIQSASAWPK
jgi:hypothetical protein